MVIIQNKAPVETSNTFTQVCDVQSLSDLDSIDFWCEFGLKSMVGSNLQDMGSVISAKGLDQKALVHKPDHVREVVQVEESWDCSPTNSTEYFSTDTPKIKINNTLSSPF